MHSAFVKLALCVGAAVAPLSANASWMWLSLDGTSTVGANHADITDLNMFRLKDASGVSDFSLNLGAQIHAAGTQLFSFTNQTGMVLKDFHLTLHCTDSVDSSGQHDLGMCNGGQVLGGGGNSSTSDLFAFVSATLQPSHSTNLDGSFTYEWLLGFSGGNVLDGQSFAIFDATTSSFALFPPAQFTVDAQASVPEPSTAYLAALILVGVAVSTSARRRSQASLVRASRNRA